MTALSSAVGRIVVGAFLCFVYKRAFEGGRLFGRPVYLVPALAFAAWNLFYNLSSGMVLAAAYLKNNSILEVIFAHFLIDFTNRIYVEPAASVTTVQVVIFAALLVCEALWAVRVTKEGA